jgi:hypothetical protein
MCVAYDNHKASENMNEPPEGSNPSYYVRLFIGLSYFLAKRLCPDTPPLLKHVFHHTSVSTTFGGFYLQKLLLTRIRLYALVSATDVLAHDPLATILWHDDNHYGSLSRKAVCPSSVFYSLQFLAVS